MMALIFMMPVFDLAVMAVMDESRNTTRMPAWA
jgi:hypothetical protein